MPSRIRVLAKSTITPLAIAGVVAVSALTGLPAGAAPTGQITINAEQDHVYSTKAISNIVTEDCSGVRTRTEFRDGVHNYDVPDGVVVVWVKAGNNKSGEGPGYGERVAVGSCSSSGYDS
jgi:hypothetical protein